LKIAIICFDRNRSRAEKIKSAIGGDIILYEQDAFKRAFELYDGIIAIMAAGIVTRKIAPLLTEKWTDPPVVAIDDQLTYAIPMLGGHHGANAIARELYTKDVVRLPVISTATEANDVASVESMASALHSTIINRKSTKSINASLLHQPVDTVQLSGPKVVIVDNDVAILSHNEGTRLVVGVGSRKGISKAAVLQAIDAGLGEIDASIDDVKVVATAFVKSHEQGIIDAISELEKPIAFVPKSVINSSRCQTKSRAAIIGLAGVAEPCALALSSLKELVLTKKAYGGVTVAIAR
jgi:cobalt-precorrin 5A hydrolase